MIIIFVAQVATRIYMFDILSNLDQEIIHPGYLEAKKQVVKGHGW